MNKEYFADNLSIEDIAEMTDKMLKYERMVKNKGSVKTSLLKIIPAAAAILLVVGFMNYASILNLGSGNYGSAGNSISMTDEEIENFRNSNEEIENFLKSISMTDEEIEKFLNIVNMIDEDIESFLKSISMTDEEIEKFRSIIRNDFYGDAWLNADRTITDGNVIVPGSAVIEQVEPADIDWAAIEQRLGDISEIYRNAIIKANAEGELEEALIRIEERNALYEEARSLEIISSTISTIEERIAEREAARYSEEAFAGVANPDDLRGVYWLGYNVEEVRDSMTGILFKFDGEHELFYKSDITDMILTLDGEEIPLVLKNDIIREVNIAGNIETWFILYFEDELDFSKIYRYRISGNYLGVPFSIS